MNRSAFRGLLIFGLLLCHAAFGSAAWAAAASCSFSITGVDFGGVNLTANTNFDTSVTFSANCTGDASKTVRVCPNFSEGTGGSTSGNPRLLLSGANQLSYNLYQNSARTTVWGSYVWAFSGSYTPPTVNVSLNSSGVGSATRTIYARVSSGQQNKPAGTYTSSFASPHTLIAYAYSTVGTCAAIGSTNGVASSFTVTASNTTTCSVSATAVDFGSTGVLQSALNASGSLSITCTASAPYTVALNGGNAGATDPTQRKMSKSAATITYGLYRDSARISPWGSTAGVDTAGGTGTGLSQSVTVYGRVPAQTTPAPGAYSDTVVVTLTY